MANFLLKKSYHINNLKISQFKDLWGSHGVFTTIRLVGKPGKLVLFNNHFINLIKSLKKYKCRIGKKPFFYKVSNEEIIDLDNYKDFKYLQFVLKNK